MRSLRYSHSLCLISDITPILSCMHLCVGCALCPSIPASHDVAFAQTCAQNKILCFLLLCICITPLGVPWHDEKGDDHFLFITTFISFRWDIPQKLVSLPDNKCLKFHECVRRFLNDFQGLPCLFFFVDFSHLSFEDCPCHLLDVEKIHGSLCHVAFVYLDGHSHLPSLSNFTSSFHNNELMVRYPPHSMMMDLTWWLQKLEDGSVMHTLHPHGPLSLEFR